MLRTNRLVPGIALTGLLACAPNNDPRLYGPQDFVRDDWIVMHGFQYKGELANGTPNGRGQAMFSGGVQVAGTFRDGVLHGTDAIIYVPGSATYRGTAAGGTLVGAEIEYEAGGMYRGEVDGYARSGRGELVMANGDVYSGTFRNGELTGTGSFYSSEHDATVIGRFVEGRMEGPALVRSERTGQRSARVYRGGSDVTQKAVAEAAKERLEQVERAEMEPLEKKVAGAEQKIQRAQAEYRAERSEIARLSSDIYSRCSPAFLTTGKGVHQERMYNGRKYRVYVPRDASESYIMQRVRTEAVERALCAEWRRDPDNFDENRFREIDQRLNGAMSQLRSERTRARVERDRVRARQERDRQRRLGEFREAEQRKIRQQAESRAEEQEARCAANPDACGCTPPEKVLACYKDKQTTCACNW